MGVIRIAVASTPLTATLAEAVPAAVAAVDEAGRHGARIVCLPETALPGHRLQERPVPDVGREQLTDAIARVGRAAARAGVVAIVSAERPTDAGREIVAVVLGGHGEPAGEQVKTQIAPEEEDLYVAGEGRHTFAVDDVTFAIAICHEAFRYPEIVRDAVLAGAQIVFVPHYVAENGAPPPVRWCDPAGSYHEKALMCRALENTVFVAGANVAGPGQGSASCVIGPDGSLVAQVPYGQVGVALADIDTATADGALARRWRPDRNRVLRPARRVA